MPSKSHRAASRQAQLKRRRRRGTARTQEFAAGPVRAEPAPDAPAAEAGSEPAPATAGVSERELVIETPARPSRPARRPRVRTATDPAMVYKFLGSELRRIGIITTAVVGVLIGLTFVLGG